MRLILLGLALVLAGCASFDDRVQGGPGGLPEVSMRGRADMIVPPGRGRLGLAVRTFVPATDGAWAEVKGARCRVTGGDFFRADLVTPARLVIPDLGPDAPQLRADCTAAAGQGADVAAPVYAWPADRRGSIPGRAWRGGSWPGFEKTGPVRYPDLAVALR